MQFLANLWSYMWAFLVTFPFAAFSLAYVIVFRMTKNTKRAVLWSINITNIFVINAISVMYSLNWPHAWSAWWWIVLYFLGFGSLLGWLQWRIKGKISLRKIGFSIWKLSFLLFGVTYVCLFGIGIWMKMQMV